MSNRPNETPHASAVGELSPAVVDAMARAATASRAGLAAERQGLPAAAARAFEESARAVGEACHLLAQPSMHEAGAKVAALRAKQAEYRCRAIKSRSAAMGATMPPPPMVAPGVDSIFRPQSTLTFGGVVAPSTPFCAGCLEQAAAAEALRQEVQALHMRVRFQIPYSYLKNTYPLPKCCTSKTICFRLCRLKVLQPSRAARRGPPRLRS
jgi:hypothetical protein